MTPTSWYDHQLGQIVNQSQTSQDMLNGPGFCGHALPVLAGINGPHAQGRCGYRSAHSVTGYLSLCTPELCRSLRMTDQSSIVRIHRGQLAGGQRILGSFDALAGPINNMFDFQSEWKRSREPRPTDGRGEIRRQVGEPLGETTPQVN